MIYTLEDNNAFKIFSYESFMRVLKENFKVIIVIPAFNEEKRIGETLKKYFRFYKDLKENGILDFEIIVVLNACTDNTRGVVSEFECDELKIIEFVQGGKGFAIIEGFKQALKEDADLIGFIDADCSTPPEAFQELVRNIKSADGAIANRWDKKSKIKVSQTFLRQFISRGFNVIVRSFFFFPHRDTQCGAKLFRRELLEKIVPRLGSSEWSFDVDLLFYARREGAWIKSIPTLWEDKRGSKVNLKVTPIKMFLSVVRLRLIHSPFRFFVEIYRNLPEKFKFHRMFG